MRLLDTAIKHISFREIREPTRDINNRLHDLREDLTFLRESVEVSRTWMPETVEQLLYNIQHTADRQHSHISFPSVTLADILTQSESLEIFLMNSLRYS